MSIILPFLKNCDFIIGNSSSGVREAPVYGVPTFNLGLRQNNRVSSESIFDFKYIDKKKLYPQLINIRKKILSKKNFGNGNVALKIYNLLKKRHFGKPQYKSILMNKTAFIPLEIKDSRLISKTFNSYRSHCKA